MRSSSIDLMRFVFMFLICLVHAVGHVTARWDLWLTNMSFVGVVGFVLISGYFGIRFSWKKALKIEGIGLGCALTVAILALLHLHLPSTPSPSPLNLNSPLTLSLPSTPSPLTLNFPLGLSLPSTPTPPPLTYHLLSLTLTLFRSYWFIHAYVVLMVLADLLHPHTSKESPNSATYHSSLNTYPSQESPSSPTYHSSLNTYPSKESPSSPTYHSSLNTYPSQESSNSTTYHSSLNTYPSQESPSSPTYHLSLNTYPSKESPSSPTYHSSLNTYPSQESSNSPTYHLSLNTYPSQESPSSPTYHSSLNTYPSPTPFLSYLPLLFIVFVWSFLQHVPGIQRFIPRTIGLDPYGALVLFGIYAVGRLYRIYDLDSRLKGRWLVPLAIGCWALSSIDWGYFARYDSPFLLVAAIGIFWCIHRIRVPDSWTKPLSFLTPSVLSIYLIHCNPYGNRVFAYLEPKFLSALSFLPPTAALYVNFFLLALTAFLAGILLDMPRRAIVASLSRLKNAIISHK